MRIKPGNRRKLIEAALGERPLDLLITNIQLVNVLTEEIYPADIGIFEGFIAHVETRKKKKNSSEMAAGAHKETDIFDGHQLYALPGLIDSHVHIESSLMTPDNFAESVLPRGTTTVITDPHEIANVLGMEGVEYMLEKSIDLPMNQFVLAPSCIPSAPDFEQSGAYFGRDEIKTLLQKDRVLGLAEVMDYPGVIFGSERMRSILDIALQKDVFIQGHSPGLSGRKLSAYLCAGPESDHEITEADEMWEKLRAGMTVDARESSISQDLARLIPGLKQGKLPLNFTLCTDDREPDDLLGEGQMDHVVRRAIDEGMQPLKAIKAASYQSARRVGLRNLGALAPGFTADLMLSESIEAPEAEYVFFRGQLAAEKGELKDKFSTRSSKIEKKNTIFLDKLEADDFKVEAPADRKEFKVHVINYPKKDTLITELQTREITQKNGFLDYTAQKNLNLLSVFNRYPGNDNRARGFIANFGLKNGAVASTVSHDCHNLTVAAVNPEDAVLAAEAVISSGGGIACARNGQLEALLELPVAGLMSDKSINYVVPQVKNVKQELRTMGIKDKHPLLKISTLTLAVIPEVKMTDRGLVDVNNQRFIPLFVE